MAEGEAGAIAALRRVDSDNSKDRAVEEADQSFPGLTESLGKYRVT